MNQGPIVKTLYRISDGGYKKEKLPHADKFYCLENFLNVFGNTQLWVFADNCLPATIEKLKKYRVQLFETQAGSSAQSWKMVARYAMEHFNEEDIVYFLEDDYLHLPKAPFAIAEGLRIADYVSLYDHPDKYVNKSEGGNPLVTHGGEETRVYLTPSSHWKLTNSTTMTFATRLSTLKDDWKIWDKYTLGSLPHDDLIFYELQSLKKWRFKLFGKNKKLITPIPALSTHIETRWLAPIVDWYAI